MRWWLTILLVAVGVACAWYRGWFQPSTPGAEPPAVWRAEVEDPLTADGTQIFAGGIVEGKQPVRALRFEVPGRIQCVNVQEGDEVHARQVLAELEAGEFQLRLAEAQAKLRIALAERDRLESGDRASAPPATGHDGGAPVADVRPRPETDLRTAPRNGAASAADHLTRPGQASSSITAEDRAIAEARVTLADVAVRQAQLLLDKTRLVAPADGTILSVSAKAGDLVASAMEEEPLTMVDRERTRVRAFVEELDAMHVAPGQRASVSAAGHPGRDYPGVVLSCSPYVRPKAHRHLKPGERIDVRVREVVIDLDEGADLLIGLPVDVFIDPRQVEFARDLRTGRREYRSAAAAPGATR